MGKRSRLTLSLSEMLGHLPKVADRTACESWWTKTPATPEDQMAAFKSMMTEALDG